MYLFEQDKGCNNLYFTLWHERVKSVVVIPGTEYFLAWCKLFLHSMVVVVKMHIIETQSWTGNVSILYDEHYYCILFRFSATHVATHTPCLKVGRFSPWCYVFETHVIILIILTYIETDVLGLSATDGFVRKYWVREAVWCIDGSDGLFIVFVDHKSK